MLQRFRENKSLQGLLLIMPTMLVMIVLLVIPLTMTVITSFGQRDADGNVIYTITLENYWRLLGFNEQGWDDLYLRIMLRSLWLAVQTTAVIIIMGFPLAYFIARSPGKRRNLYLFLVLVPLWTNFVIRIYAWVMILRGQGVLNSILGMLAGLFSLPFEPFDFYPSQGAVLVGMVYEFLPFMILPIYTSLEKIDPALYEAAADLYANAFRTFWRVTVPLAMPGIVAGTILTFVPVIGTFVVSDILGGRQVILVGNLVQRQFLDARNPPFGSAASIILLVLTLALTLYYTRRFGLGEEIAAG
ncbi:MAG: ABC transporter permease [Caldilineaceae bacterium]|nr:ABC transporter permease [Caldilineaceae bacterium]